MAVVTKFQVGDRVKHRKGGEYVITKVPVEFCKLEYCNEMYYEYQFMIPGEVTFWIRRMSEMEDGRFEKIGSVYE